MLENRLQEESQEVIKGSNTSTELKLYQKGVQRLRSSSQKSIKGKIEKDKFDQTHNHFSSNQVDKKAKEVSEKSVSINNEGKTINTSINYRPGRRKKELGKINPRNERTHPVVGRYTGYSQDHSPSKNYEKREMSFSGGRQEGLIRGGSNEGYKSATRTKIEDIENPALNYCDRELQQKKKMNSVKNRKKFL